jgi:hypothetical protein
MHDYQINEETLIDRMTTDHKILNGGLRTIRDLFDAAVDEGGIEKRMAEIHREMVKFRAELSEHLCQESRDGLLEEAVACRPLIGPEVEILLEDRNALFYDLSRLMTYCHGHALSPDHWSFLKDEFTEFSRKLKSHEERGNKLLQKGFNLDCHELLD